MAVESQVQQLTVRVSRELHDAMKTLSLATGKSMNDIVQAALREHLAGDARRRTVDAFFDEARDNYRVALEKLADL